MIVIILSFLLVLTACSDDNDETTPTSPEEAVSLVKLAATMETERDFYNYFLNPGDRLDEIEQDYQLMKEILETGLNSSETTLHLSKFENGDMVIVEVTPELDGQVFVQNIYEVPEEAKDFFATIVNNTPSDFQDGNND